MSINNKKVIDHGLEITITVFLRFKVYVVVMIKKSVNVII